MTPATPAQRAYLTAHGRYIAGMTRSEAALAVAFTHATLEHQRITS